MNAHEDVKGEQMSKATNVSPIEGALYAIESQIKMARKVVDAFAVAVAKSPAHELEWSGGAFEAAARLQVLSHLKDLAEKATFADALAVARNEMLRHARWPHRSTSMPANLMHQLIGAEYAGFVADYESLAESEEK